VPVAKGILHLNFYASAKKMLLEECFQFVPEPRVFANIGSGTVQSSRSKAMRKAFDRQLRLDCPQVADVPLNLGCRHETVPILRALQHIYSRPELRDSILRAIARDVNGRSSARRGRPGLSYWEILVLAAVRLGCNCNYDQLQDLAENHRALRQAMGIGAWEDDREGRKRFDWRRIESNLNLLRPETVEQINRILAQEGHRLEPTAAETVRGDSFVMETNIHFPTDNSLIRDGLRKVLGLATTIADRFGLDGWRQHQHLYRKARKLSRQIERIAARKGNDTRTRLQAPYRELLQLANMVCTRADDLRQTLQKAGGGDVETLALDRQLATFLQRTRHVCGAARRRVFDGEAVPNGEKLFSIFEPHTQLYIRGKAGHPMQFGRLVLIYEDGAGFITHYSLLARDETDRDAAVRETSKAQRRHRGRIRRASLDRGFHSPENQIALAKIVKHFCLPMLGTHQAREQEKKAGVEFRAARQRHPGIESAIGALQSGNGLERCRDRTDRGFARYIGLGVLGRNLHLLGKLLLAREAPDCQAAQSRRKRAA
jgi:transposase, IS5 family